VSFIHISSTVPSVQSVQFLPQHFCWDFGVVVEAEEMAGEEAAGNSEPVVGEVTTGSDGFSKNGTTVGRGGMNGLGNCREPGVKKVCVPSAPSRTSRSTDTRRAILTRGQEDGAEVHSRPVPIFRHHRESHSATLTSPSRNLGGTRSSLGASRAAYESLLEHFLLAAPSLVRPNHTGLGTVRTSRTPAAPGNVGRTRAG